MAFRVKAGQYILCQSSCLKFAAVHLVTDVSVSERRANTVFVWIRTQASLAQERHHIDLYNGCCRSEDGSVDPELLDIDAASALRLGADPAVVMTEYFKRRASNAP